MVPRHERGSSSTAAAHDWCVTVLERCWRSKYAIQAANDGSRELPVLSCSPEWCIVVKLLALAAAIVHKDSCSCHEEERRRGEKRPFPGPCCIQQRTCHRHTYMPHPHLRPCDLTDVHMMQSHNSCTCTSLGGLMPQNLQPGAALQKCLACRSLTTGVSIHMKTTLAGETPEGRNEV